MKIKSHSNVNNLPDDDSCHPNLTPKCTYSVIGIDFEFYRIVDDKNEPTLYPKTLFDIVDLKYPETWVKSDYGDGEWYIDPPELSREYFYEDYFDGVAEAVSVYNCYLDKNGLRR